MWSQILLCLLVGFAFASENPAWSPQNRYVYQIGGHIVASLDQVNDEYSGSAFRGKLEVQPRSDGNLAARISEPQDASLQAELPYGLDMGIKESDLTFKPAPFSGKPFQIVLYKGVIRDVIVSKQIKNWEANIIKSIVSQLQLDTKATNLIQSSINLLTQEDKNNGVYKTMEETSTGVTETLYEIHPYPDYLLQSEPWLVPQRKLMEQGQVLEVVKTKNFTHSIHSPSYHTGFEGISSYHPGNTLAEFLSRTSVGRTILTGTLDQFTIQSSITEEQIALSPTFGNGQKGSVKSLLNLTLSEISQPVPENQYEVEDPVNVGIVYGYNNPYSTDNGPRRSKEHDHAGDPGSAESQYSHRPRSLRRPIRNLKDYYDDMDVQDWHQEKPQVNEAPPSPLLPLTVGYDGQSYKKTQNIIETARRLSQEIGQEYPHPKKILVEYTPQKFVLLTSLVRIMDQDEIAKVENQLYSSSSGPQYSWYAFRDSVAQAATGPAFSNIKQWIESGKFSDLEAAQLIATSAHNTRQPTEELAKLYFEMIQNDNIMHKPYLNVSILFSYSTLLHEAYVSDQASIGKYPVFTYGPFRTSRTENFVKKEVIPYLTRKLHESISKGDNHKIYVYIKALGNIGQKEILEAFEPYLEGQKKASHFQRFFMVVNLRDLAKANPQVGRSVFYKIYQNPGEVEELRVAAVYNLIHTRPSATMLQEMAYNTKVDPSSYVNAAVKSIIEYASEEEAPYYNELRAAAASAKPLLTTQEYGAQYSKGFLLNYLHKELQLHYLEYIQTYGGQDHSMPKGLKYIFQSKFGGVMKDFVYFQALTSSVEDFVNVFYQQTKGYQHQQQEKQAQNSAQYPWSSEYVAKLLNLQNVQREQLEGNVFFKMGASQWLLSFDNNTFENLPEYVQELESHLRQGQHNEYSKMMVGQESTLAFPTLVGFPFFYNYDSPVLIKIKSEISAVAQPQVSSGQVLQKPDNVQADFDINAVVTGGIHAQFGFFIPYNHQQYSAGYKKQFQVVVPLNGKLKLNVQNVNKPQLKVEMENPGAQETIRLAHYSSFPYTARNDVYTSKPNLKVIRSRSPYRQHNVFGDKSTGIGFFYHVESDERIDSTYLYEKLTQQDPIASMLEPFVDEDVKYVHIDVGIEASKSTTQQIAFSLGYQSEYQPNEPSPKKPQFNEISDIPNFVDDPEKRENVFAEKLGAHIPNAEVYVGDATVEFVGQSKIKYSATVGVAKSNVYPHSRFMALVRQLVNQRPQTLAYIHGLSSIPNTNGLNVDYAMKIDPTISSKVEGLLRHEDRLSRVVAEIQSTKSKERVQYLQQHQEYQTCKYQMQQGNTQLHACAKVTADANLLDKFSIKMKVNDMHPYVVNATYHSYSILRHYLYPRVYENVVDPQPENRFDIYGSYSPDLERVNVSISSSYGKSEFKNVPLNRWARLVLVPHPVFHSKARLLGEVLKEDIYRPFCVLDKTAIKTFDNKTYPASLSNSWSVALQYVPRRPSPVPNKIYQSVPEQLQQAVHSYVVYTRATRESSSQKEVQVVLQMPGSQGKVVKIILQPSQRQDKGPKVTVDNQEVKYTSESSSDYYDGHIQIYALPYHEVKVEIRDAFYLIFNGQTLKLTVVDSKFRDSTRGLCGTFTGEPETDFLSPENCILYGSQQFVDSYTVSQSSPRSHTPSSHCYEKKAIFVDYISGQDAGRSSDYERRTGDECTGHLSRYQEQDGEICFTVRALPFCKQGCKSLHSNTKYIDVHCLEPSATTAFWRSQLDKKINVDFTMMETTKKVPMEVPARCVP